MAAPTRAELQARLAKLERALARERKREGSAEDLARARDAQAATAKILRVIRKSPSDVQPVFEAIAQGALRLFDAWSVTVVRFDGTHIHFAAASEAKPKSEAYVRAMFPRPPSKTNIVGRCILARDVIELVDARRDRSPKMREVARVRGFRSALTVPLMLGRAPIGAIAVTRVEAGRFTREEVRLLQTFADQAVIAIENARRFHQTKEALERQTATADILKVISGSPDNVQPVLDAVAHSSMRLLGALSASVSIRVGDTLQLGAFTSTSKTGDQAVKDIFPLSLTDKRSTILAQSVLKAAPAQVGDAQSTRRRPELRKVARRRGFQSIIGVPMLSKGTAIGTVSVTRREAGGFSDHEVELLTTFADQAVIAIENVRLFNETKEALERQTATADILKVISGSPTNIQPVLDAVAENAARLCQASDAIIQLREGDELRWAAHFGTIPNLPQNGRREISRELVTGRAVLEGRQIHVHDLPAQSKEYPLGSRIAAEFGYHTILATPLMREGNAIGVIMVRHKDVRPFNDKHLALVSTFADQAVIAIENVRLFNETKEALERQTATAEILQVISASHSNVQPVLDAVVERAARICESDDAVLFVLEGEAFHRRAHFELAANIAITDRLPNVLLDRSTIMGAAVLDRQPIQIEDMQSLPDGLYEAGRRRAREMDHRTTLAVPLLREDAALGAVLLRRKAARRFTDKQIALLRTFADQAAIGIENVRLFNETNEALERQTATAEILSVIASSPSRVEPVFEAIVASAKRLFAAKSAVLLLRGESHFSVGAYAGPEIADLPEQVREAPLDASKNFPSRAILGGEIVHIPDWSGDDIPEHEKIVAKAFGIRSGLQVPLLRKGSGIGALAITRETTGHYGEKEIALLRSFADQAVIAIENVRLFNETKEALERQTATSEILKVISSSPTDVQPVFDTIVKNAVELSDALFSAVYRYDGEQLHLVAHHNYTPEVLELENRVYPMRPDRGQAVGRAILDRRLVHIPDALTDADYQHDIATTGGWRSMVAVPMFREGTPVGVIWVARAQIGPFSNHQIALLQTFADQAVIAIENVRLFNETKEALERQTASAEVLQVISGSLADTQPVFEVILESCERLFKGRHVGITLVGEDGLAHIGAYHGPAAQTFREMYPLPINRETGTGLAIIERRTLHYPDAEGGAEVPESVRRGARITGLKSVVMTPLLGKDRTIGAMFVGREFAGAFSGNEIALIKTFADQAVIAIENVRLFNETKEALERQTATAEILRVISSSPTDVQPVFNMIGKLAGKLCAADISAVARFDGEKLQLVALHGVAEDGVEGIRRAFPMYPGEETVIARAFDKCDVEHVADVMDNPSYARKGAARAGGYRGCLGVPMVREGNVIGVIFVARVVPGHFADSQVALLQTFADQAVIAIENVRLFNETKEALDRQTATAEILEVMSRSQSDLQPAFDTISASAMRLCDGDQGLVYTYDGVLVHIASLESMTPEAEAATRELFPMPASRGYGAGRAILTRAPVQVADVFEDPEYEITDTARVTGWRSVLAVPMLRAGIPIGAIAVVRRQPMAFTENQVALLKTFADQAVIAIENVRLFNETNESLERQTATAEILRVISSSPTDVQPVFDAIVASAARLCDAVQSAAVTLEDGMLHLVAHRNWTGEGRTLAESLFPMPVDRDHLTALAVRENRVIHSVNLQQDPEAPATSRELAIAQGYDALLIMPMLREGRSRGAVVVARKSPFTEHQIALLQTFADQAVIAIDNVRLFNETREALERQTATAEILKVISGSPTDVQPVLETVAEYATRLCEADRAFIFRFDGEFLRSAVTLNASPELREFVERNPIRPGQHSATARAGLEKRTIHIPDVTSDPNYSYGAKDVDPIRTVLTVPMLKGDELLGVILTYRLEVKPFSEKQIALIETFADQAVIAIENVRLFNETREALEQQRASGEVLSVISNSIADAQPVFEKIVESCERLFAGSKVGLNLVGPDGLVHPGAYGKFPGVDKLRTEGFPHPANEESATGAAILARDVIHYPDVLGDPHVPFYARRGAEAVGFRSFIMAPLLSEGRGLGAIFVGRETVGTFTEKEIALLKTFANQAVIAIQNARLFNETKEALERQTATAEILKVISSSPTETQPVFEAIVDACLRLFQGHDIGINLLDEAGGLYLSAVRSSKAETLKNYFEHAPTRRAGSGVRLRRTAVCYPDVEAADVPEEVRDGCRAGDVRSIVYAPLVLEGRGIGSLWVGRATPGPFAEEQIALLKTFADQAVIAIQNVRLFKEIQQRTEALSKSVGQLTALGEVSQALSSTLDLEKVLQTIVARAVQLTGLDGGAIYEYDDAQKGFYLRGAEHLPEEAIALSRSTPMRLGEGAIGRAGLAGEAVQVSDILEESYQSRVREFLIRSGSRAVIAVPLLREGKLLGALAVTRNSPGEFAPEILELLKTFATQSAIAIQNARLFREIEEKGRELELASQHKSQFLASMSHELRTPLNAILGFNEMILGEVYGEVPADMKEPLEDIQTSGKHLLRLINNVLDLAKIEAGRMELALADYSVHDIVESVRTTLRPLAEAKGLEFLASVPNDLPLAHGDSGRLTQCLMNLAGNSLKFTKEGHVSISVEPNGETLAFRVADTGIGIPPDKIDSLFTEFKQTDATIASEYGGTGLGLAITKQFIEMHGGRIWVESELGKGSSFIFEIPLRAEGGAAA